MVACKWKLAMLICCGLVWGCAEEEDARPTPGPREGLTEEERPQGTWFMYGGSDTGIRKREDIAKEITMLTLGDSTYSLTFMMPDMQFSFTEAGKVDYDYRRRLAKFIVLSASGVDFSGPEPRKLVEVPDIMIWEREPGEEYFREWAMDADYMRISAPETEDSYFVRLKAGEEPGKVDIDVMKSLSKGKSEE